MAPPRCWRKVPMSTERRAGRHHQGEPAGSCWGQVLRTGKNREPSMPAACVSSRTAALPSAGIWSNADGGSGVLSEQFTSANVAPDHLHGPVASSGHDRTFRCSGCCCRSGQATSERVAGIHPGIESSGLRGALYDQCDSLVAEAQPPLTTELVHVGIGYAVTSGNFTKIGPDVMPAASSHDCKDCTGHVLKRRP